MPEPSAPRGSATPVVLGLLLLNLALLGGQAALGKEAALRQESFSALAIARNPWYLATLGCLAGHALVWPAVLRQTPLGFAYAFSTLQYPVTLLLSRTIFGETVTPLNVGGATLIVCGVLVLTRAATRAG